MGNLKVELCVKYQHKQLQQF